LINIKFCEYRHAVTKELGYIAQYNGQVVAVINGTKKITRNMSTARKFMEKKGYVKKAGAVDEQAG